MQIRMLPMSTDFTLSRHYQNEESNILGTYVHRKSIFGGERAETVDDGHWNIASLRNELLT